MCLSAPSCSESCDSQSQIEDSTHEESGQHPSRLDDHNRNLTHRIDTGQTGRSFPPQRDRPGKKRTRTSDPSSFPGFASDLSLVEVSTIALSNQENSEGSQEGRGSLSNHSCATWYEARVVDVKFLTTGHGDDHLASCIPATIPVDDFQDQQTSLDDSCPLTMNDQHEGNHTVCLSQGVALSIQLPDGSSPYEVPLNCVRLPPPPTVVELFVPRPNVLAEVRLDGDRPCWKLCCVKRVLEEGGLIEVLMTEDVDTCDIEEEKEMKVVTRQCLRRADLGTESRTLAEMGGVVREVVHWPIEGNEMLADEGWVGESRLEALRKRAKLFKATAEEDDDPDSSHFKVILIGQPPSVTQAKSALNSLYKNLRLPHQFQERRERRLKLLAERREAYHEARMVEFPVKEGMIGLIIGRQGEKLARAAKDFQVELRVLPDDQGIRRVRVYGPDREKINVAKEELQLVYQEIFLDEGTFSLLEVEKAGEFQDIAVRSGVCCVWLDSQRTALILWGLKRYIEAFRFLFEDLFNSSKRRPTNIPRLHHQNTYHSVHQPSNVGPPPLFVPFSSNAAPLLPIQPFDNQPSDSHRSNAHERQLRHSTSFYSQRGTSHESSSYLYSLSKANSFHHISHTARTHRPSNNNPLLQRTSSTVASQSFQSRFNHHFTPAPYNGADEDWNPYARSFTTVDNPPSARWNNKTDTLHSDRRRRNQHNRHYNNNYNNGVHY